MLLRFHNLWNFDIILPDLATIMDFSIVQDVSRYCHNHILSYDYDSLQNLQN